MNSKDSRLDKEENRTFQIEENFSNQNEETTPLFQCIYDFTKQPLYFYDHNDSFLLDFKGKLHTIEQLDWERHHESDKQELMEIYGTGDKEIDQEIEMELEEELLEATQNSEVELIHCLEEEILKNF